MVSFGDAPHANLRKGLRALRITLACKCMCFYCRAYVFFATMHRARLALSGHTAHDTDASILEHFSFKMYIYYVYAS